ncbi:MAG TPA: RidA family protein [Stellaceae bacterium]|nr:RidA family protein [Stellaceae bacterium]
MKKIYNPAAIAAPPGYSHGIEMPANARWLYTAGQLGNAKDGKFPADFAAQAEQAWRNLIAVLADAGMATSDLVKINTYLTRREDLAAYREVRTRILGEIKPASTLIVISALAREGALIEIEAVAAKA